MAGVGRALADSSLDRVLGDEGEQESGSWQVVKVHKSKSQKSEAKSAGKVTASEFFAHVTVDVDYLQPQESQKVDPEEWTNVTSFHSHCIWMVFSDLRVIKHCSLP